MPTLEALAQQIRAAFPQAEVSTRAPREVRLRVDREQLPALADYLRDTFQAQPELILAEDSRVQDGWFTLRYLFEVAGADIVIVVTATVPAGDPTFPSLASRWY